MSIMFGRHRASKDPKAYIEELQKRRAKAFGTVQAPLYNGHIKAIILVDGVKHRVPQSAWGEDNAELTFKSGYATIETPLRRHGRVLFDQASAEGWLKGQSAEMPPQRSQTSRRQRSGFRLRLLRPRRSA
jgi:hypothetical protein